MFLMRILERMMWRSFICPVGHRISFIPETKQDVVRGKARSISFHVPQILFVIYNLMDLSVREENIHLISLQNSLFFINFSDCSDFKTSATLLKLE